jgi:FemAB-related protein (PEP-CTERM system-associated)
LSEVNVAPPESAQTGKTEAVRVEALTPATEAEWDAFVASRPGASHYHRSGWGRVIHEAFRQRPLYRIARSNAGIEGVLPLVAFANPVFGRYLVSVPFLNRGGLLTATDRARDALLEDARALVAETRSTFCELRHVEGVDPDLPARETKVSMSMAVDCEEEELWKAIGAKVRNLVRKAEKGGLTVREGNPVTELDRFYDVFARNMRDLGTPVYDRAFFREIFREFPEDARLTLVEAEGKVVAAAGICVAGPALTEIHWAASRREFLRQSPNMLLYWEAISHAARQGVKEFCFGRSTKGSGPYRFKKQWGAVATRLRWEYLLPEGGSLPGLNPDNPKFRLAVGLWKKLPLPLTRLLGPPIVRHLP